MDSLGRQEGISLIEVVVATALALSLAVGLTTFGLNMTTSRVDMSRQNRALHIARRQIEWEQAQNAYDAAYYTEHISTVSPETRDISSEVSGGEMVITRQFGDISDSSQNQIRVTVEVSWDSGRIGPGGLPVPEEDSISTVIWQR